MVSVKSNSCVLHVPDMLNTRLPCGSDGKASACNVADLGSVPGSGRSSAEGYGNPLQYFCLESPMGRRAW